jgi:hypothetical protein
MRWARTVALIAKINTSKNFVENSQGKRSRGRLGADGRKINNVL